MKWRWLRWVKTLDPAKLVLKEENRVKKNKNKKAK
jgi:hypothetical protein